MEANRLPSLRSNFTPLLTHSRPLRPQVFFISPPPHPPKFFITRPSTSNNSNSVEDDSALPAVPPPDTVEIRFRRGARSRSRQLQQGNEGGATNTPPTPTKDWESMTLAEKAVELYVREKGLLFWLNKFA